MLAMVACWERGALRRARGGRGGDAVGLCDFRYCSPFCTRIPSCGTRPTARRAG